MGQIPNYCRACGERLVNEERIFCGRTSCQDRARADALDPYSKRAGAPDTLGAMPKSRMLELLAIDAVSLGGGDLGILTRVSVLTEEVKKYPWDDCACFLVKRAEIHGLAAKCKEQQEEARLMRVRRDRASQTLQDWDGRARAIHQPSDPSKPLTPDNCPNHPPASGLMDVWCLVCGVSKGLHARSHLAGHPVMETVMETEETLRVREREHDADLQSREREFFRIRKQAGLARVGSGASSATHLPARVPSAVRDCILGFGPDYVEPFSDLTLQVLPQTIFRGKRLLIDEDIAPFFSVRKLCVGVANGLPNLGDAGIPAAAFTRNAFGIGFSIETAVPGILISLRCAITLMYAARSMPCSWAKGFDDHERVRV